MARRKAVDPTTETTALAQPDERTAGSGTETEASKPQKKAEPPATAVRDFDDLVREVRDLEEMTGCRGWKLFFADLLSARASAKAGFLTAEKMNDVVRCQATVKLVDDQIARLQAPVDRLNELRTRYPLFENEFCYTGSLDTETGRVALSYHKPAAPIDPLCDAADPDGAEGAEEPPSCEGPGDDLAVGPGVAASDRQDDAPSADAPSGDDDADDDDDTDDAGAPADPFED